MCFGLHNPDGPVDPFGDFVALHYFHLILLVKFFKLDRVLKSDLDVFDKFREWKSVGIIWKAVLKM